MKKYLCLQIAREKTSIYFSYNISLYSERRYFKFPEQAKSLFLKRDSAKHFY